MKKRLLSLALVAVMVMAFAVPTAFAAPAAVKEVVASRSSVVLSPAGKVSIKYRVLPSRASQNVRWSVSNSAVVSVTQKGVVTAKANGRAWVVVRALGTKKYDRVLITVRTLATSVSLSESAVALDAGKSTSLVATVLPASTSKKTVSWKSDKPEVATVDSMGKVTAVANGEAVISATTTDGSKKVATAAVTVTTPVAGVSVAPVKLVFSTSDTAATAAKSVDATVLPATASNQKLIWTLEGAGADKFVLTVDDSTKSAKLAIATGKTVTVADAPVLKVKSESNSAAAQTVLVSVVANVVPTFSHVPAAVGPTKAAVDAAINAVKSYVTFELEDKTNKAQIVVNLSGAGVPAADMLKVKAAFGGTSIPVKVTFSDSGAPVGVTADPVFGGVYTVMVNLAEPKARIEAKTIEMVNGAKAPYNLVVKYPKPTLAVAAPGTYTSADSAKNLIMNDVLGKLMGAGKPITFSTSKVTINGDTFDAEMAKALYPLSTENTRTVASYVADPAYFGGKLPVAISASSDVAEFKPTTLASSANFGFKYIYDLDVATFKHMAKEATVDVPNANGSVSTFAYQATYVDAKITFSKPTITGVGPEVIAAQAAIDAFWPAIFANSNVAVDGTVPAHDLLTVRRDKVTKTMLDTLKASTVLDGDTKVPVMVTVESGGVSLASSPFAIDNRFGTGTRIMWVDLAATTASKTFGEFVNASGLKTVYAVDYSFEPVTARMYNVHNNYVKSLGQDQADYDLNKYILDKIVTGSSLVTVPDADKLPTGVVPADLIDLVGLTEGASSITIKEPSAALKTYLVNTFGGMPIEIIFDGSETVNEYEPATAGFDRSARWAYGDDRPIYVYILDLNTFKLAAGETSKTQDINFTTVNGMTTKVALTLTK